MPDLLELVLSLRRHPGMYLERPTFETVVAYLSGHDAACGSLTGFHEFLVLRVGEGNNVVWPALVRNLAGDSAAEDAADRALEVLFELVIEFLAEVRAGGLDAIVHEHQTWLRSQSWYDADLERMRVSPAPEVYTADEAAALLGLTRGALFEGLGALKLWPGRRGAEVVFRRDAVIAAARRLQEPIAAPSLHGESPEPARSRVGRVPRG